MDKLLIFGIALVILWLALRLGLAITSVFLHLLWVFAIILLVIWFISKPRSGE